jgi:hypothetical protein
LIFKNNSKIKNGLESKFCKLYFVVMLKYNKDLARFILVERGRPPMVIFQLDVVHNWSNQLPQKLVDEKLSSFIA